MELLVFFVKGLLMGVIIALPFGPVGVLCLQRSIHGGVLIGLLSGAGAAVADAFYGCVAAFGVQVVSNFLKSHHFVIQVVGGALLFAMGVRMLFDKSPAKSVSVEYHKLFGAFASILGLSLANPVAVVAFLAIFASFGLGDADADVFHAVAVVLGVFFGSMLWWVLLAFGGAYLRETLTKRMNRVKAISGGVIAVFGVFAFAEAFFK